MKFVPCNNDKAIADLKLIYQSATEEGALLLLDYFSERRDDKYPQIRKSWRTYWQNLNALSITRLTYEKPPRKESSFQLMMPAESHLFSDRTSL